MAHPIARCQATLGSIMRSPSFGASMKKLEIAFRLSFRFMITPIFVGVAVVMMSSVAYYWFALVQPAWEHPAGSWTWCLNTGMGVWLLFNVCWNYFRCMFTPSFHPLPLDSLGNTKRKGDCASILGTCGGCTTKPSKHAYVAAKTNDTNDSSPSSSASTAHHRHDAGDGSTSASSSSSSSSAVDVDAWNYCKRCDLVTPPRAMHCFLCNRCVLGMDHHCPWLATCIGYNNHSYFFLFLFYVVVGCLYLAAWTVPMFYSIVVHKQYRAWEGVQIRRDRFALTMMGILPATFVIAVGAMMIWHGVVLACGATSLEFRYVVDWLKDVVARCRRRNNSIAQESTGGGKQRQHPFDQGGFAENWKEIFGVRGRKLWWLLWCMPISHVRSGNGIDKFVCEYTSPQKGRYATMNV